MDPEYERWKRAQDAKHEASVRQRAEMGAEIAALKAKVFGPSRAAATPQQQQTPPVNNAPVERGLAPHERQPMQNPAVQNPPAQPQPEQNQARAQQNRGGGGQQRGGRGDARGGEYLGLVHERTGTWLTC